MRKKIITQLKVDSCVMIEAPRQSLVRALLVPKSFRQSELKSFGELLGDTVCKFVSQIHQLFEYLVIGLYFVIVPTF